MQLNNIILNLKKTFLLVLLILMQTTFLFAQDMTGSNKREQAIYSLIDKYAQAREKKDTVLLKNILTPDIDQLVSTGEWRKGMRESVEGMMQSSESNQGSRRLIIDKIRFLSTENAIVDARYEIQNADGTQRKMWSTFIVTLHDDRWKISAIRNMLPTRQP